MLVSALDKAAEKPLPPKALAMALIDHYRTLVGKSKLGKRSHNGLPMGNKDNTIHSALYSTCRTYGTRLGDEYRNVLLNQHLYIRQKRAEYVTTPAPNKRLKDATWEWFVLNP